MTEEEFNYGFDRVANVIGSLAIALLVVIPWMVGFYIIVCKVLARIL